METHLNNTNSPSVKATLLPALTGIRFFAIFHIFLFHLWSLYSMEKPPEYKALMQSVGQLPDTLITFLSHGYFSTSFFFMLSGFILAYLYWGANGQLTSSKKHFWLLRFSRLFPIHIIILIITFLLFTGFLLGENTPVPTMVFSALATLTLTQAWVPQWVPVWSWPTWALSALLFMYLIMPWLMLRLSKLSRKYMILLLAALPLISLLPTIVIALGMFSGEKLNRDWSIFLGATPIFWVAHFVAGMLLSRAFGISRFNSSWKKPPHWLAVGDIALLSVIAIACIPNIEEPLKYFLRHGLLMPLYMLIILDLARGNGLASRLFSLPGTKFFGEMSFSIFIWQNLIMAMCWEVARSTGNNQFLGACIGMIIISVISTYLIEKPIARKMRKKILQGSHAKVNGVT